MLYFVLTWALTTGALYLLNYLTPDQLYGDNLWLSAIVIVGISAVVSLVVSIIIGLIAFKIIAGNLFSHAKIVFTMLVMWVLCIAAGIWATVIGVNAATAWTSLYIAPNIYWAVVLVTGVAMGLCSKSTVKVKHTST